MRGGGDVVERRASVHLIVPSGVARNSACREPQEPGLPD
jgi:hypothetical protein